MSTILRQLRMLCYLPRHPRQVTTSELRQKLELEDFSVSARTVQRDLEALSARFPISSEERGRSLAWRFDRDATLFSIPALDPHTAFTFLLSRQHLSELLPKGCAEALQPYYDAAEEALRGDRAADLRRWVKKVRIVPRGQPLRPAAVDPKALAAIHEALLRDRRLQVSYRPRGQKRARKYELNPLGLVLRYEVGYLVCTAWDYADVRHFSLHRFRKARILDQPVRRPRGFKLDDYLQPGGQGPFDYPVGGRIELEALFDPVLAGHLRETPLSPHQRLGELDDGRVRLRAPVQDTAQLRWWLLGFGGGVEVLAPAALRDEFAQTARAMSRMYRRRAAPPAPRG